MDEHHQCFDKAPVTARLDFQGEGHDVTLPRSSLVLQIFTVFLTPGRHGLWILQMETGPLLRKQWSSWGDSGHRLFKLTLGPQ